MTTVSSVTSAAAQNIAGTTELLADTQERFLTMLITQLKNQDPMNPMDNAQITSQVAQLSTVTGINQLNQTLLALAGQLDVSQSMQAASLIGKEILVPGADIRVGTSGDTTQVTHFGMDLLSPASGVRVLITDVGGKAVRTMELENLQAGVHSLEWDGKDDSGNIVPDGRYLVRVSAFDPQQAPVSVAPLTSGRVASVASSNGGVKLDLGLAGSYLLSDVRKIM
ncbi:MAG TPA: flagellar hook capping FlgD N-terminal domain-containing protein [Burkholderiaceae bacterium]|jgi:flagellar basal-body rod modification protein FlgD|nr:flagellar hook capping FlgD N-terminal domain-containing protein [Burkholderiaceae bacterium]